MALLIFMIWMEIVRDMLDEDIGLVKIFDKKDSSDDVQCYNELLRKLVQNEDKANEK